MGAPSFLLLLLLPLATPSWGIHAPYPLRGAGRPSCLFQYQELGRGTAANVVSEYVLRNHAIGGTEYHEVLVVSEFHRDAELLTRRYHREVRFGRREMAAWEKGGAEAWHWAQVLPIVDFAKRFYDERKHWSPHYLEEVPLIAQRYLNDSIYVEVIQKSTGHIVGSERFLLGPFGLRNGVRVVEGDLVRRYYGPSTGFRPATEQDLPGSLPRPPERLAMAQHLGIDYGRSAVASGFPGLEIGLEIEIGLVAIEPTLPRALRGRIWGELWLQIMRTIFHSSDDRLNFYGTTVSAYTDAENAELFRWMGWEDLRRYRDRNGRAVSLEPEQPVPPIHVPNETMDWYPLLYQPHRVTAFNGQVGDGQRSLFAPPDLSGRRREVASGRSITPDAFEGVGTLVDALAGEDEGFAQSASAAIVRMYELTAIHREVAHRSRTNPQQARRAIDAAIAADHRFLHELQHRLPAIASDARASHRLRVARLLAQLAAIPNAPDFLSPAHVQRTYFVPFLTDASEEIRQLALHALREFGPARLFDVVGSICDLDLDFGSEMFDPALCATADWVNPLPSAAQQRANRIAAAAERRGGDANAVAIRALRLFLSGRQRSPASALAALHALADRSTPALEDLLVLACQNAVRR